MSFWQLAKFCNYYCRIRRKKISFGNFGLAPPQLRHVSYGPDLTVTLASLNVRGRVNPRQVPLLRNVGHLHLFQDPAVGILYNCADPMVGYLQYCNAQMSNAQGEGQLGALQLIETLHPLRPDPFTCLVVQASRCAADLSFITCLSEITSFSCFEKMPPTTIFLSFHL